MTKKHNKKLYVLGTAVSLVLGLLAADRLFNMTNPAPNLAENGLGREQAAADDSLSTRKLDYRSAVAASESVVEPIKLSGEIEQLGNGETSELTTDDAVSRIGAGDLDYLSEFFDLQFQCRNFKDREIQALAGEEASIRLARMLDPSVQLTERNVVAEIEMRAHDQRLRCEEQLGLTGAEAESIEERIGSGAEAGGPYYRLMYALWSPTDRGTAVSAVATAEYEVKAAQYTADNLVDDPQLAFLALGISYLDGDLFTSQQPGVGKAYLMAAEACGVNPNITSQLIRDKFDFARELYIVTRTLPANVDVLAAQSAIELVKRWCP